MNVGESKSYWKVQVYKPDGRTTWLTVNPQDAWRVEYMWHYGVWPADDAYIQSYEVTVTATEVT